VEICASPDGQGSKVVRYAVVIEKADGNYSVYVPDLPGCISTGRTVEEAERNIHDAISLHLEGIREDGQAPPEPTTHVAELEVA
jgi:predicted RNase H-like HicB family nuclease